MDTLKRYLGCIYGIAIGDALGFPVESEVGGSLTITNLLDKRYSDDTQMSLATANGLITAKAGETPVVAVYHEYLKWLEDQKDPARRRAPNGTCLAALGTGTMGSLDTGINNSKDSGGVMRTAPVGLACAPKTAFKYGVDFAAITHSHPLGYLPAGYLAELISHLSQGMDLTDAVEACRETLMEQPGHEDVLRKVSQACDCAFSEIGTRLAISEIGGGWVGEEALAISLFCALRFRDDWKTGTLAAVNHGGDSDTTGSITGAILGTLLGVDAIPSAWVERIENTELLGSTAERLHAAFSASRFDVVKQRPSVYPVSLKCPICGKGLKIPRAGTFACPGCRVKLSFDRDAKVTLA
jgi:ADP-ribosylglycohydrolase